MRLTKTRVLITGASRGLGRSIAEVVAQRGAEVALVARNQEALELLAKELGGKAYPTDLTAPVAVGQLVERVEADGPVDVLINNAGLDCVRLLPDTSAQEMRDLLQVNLMAPMELCRQLMPLMLQRGRGHIVNVSSMGAVSVSPGVTVYATSKAGLSHFTAGIRQELRGKPVKTTLVQIGAVKTDMIDGIRGFGPARRAIERSQRLHMLPREDLEPEVVANAIADAIERGRRYVTLPRRIAASAILTELPRKMSAAMLFGIDMSAD
ncbi:short-chain dehydrogenase [Mycobacterium sp. 852002-51163_SCH5372311]|uniref:SDR family NAD(P)-dependent oxidoreductase n=1 Tax=Mycobacterium sp. 852002-51163_SCH5372311 TaxID=1834097 RepID=UPI0007FCB0EE|nr:SDR family NAD(P)-dependent oxidoreductase [Mycobacterium sp. 852002-51163_SCH5372311]OBF80752.1 short-chain dehydrogenase [Mycobacterium sp. 852002-51163_SCH5372311]